MEKKRSVSVFKWWIRAGCFAGALVMSLPAHAACDSFSFDFEDGNLGPWTHTATHAGSNGSAFVTTHNGSKMAYLQHEGEFSDALVVYFPYCGSQILAFDMEAHAFAPAGFGINTSAKAGVQLTFWNQNVALGTTSMIYVRGPYFHLGPHDIAVDTAEHRYSATMESFAGVAGLASAAPITKVSMSFFAAATGMLHIYPRGEVWFDNVSAVPEPDRQTLMWAGLAGLGVATVLRRRLQLND